MKKRFAAVLAISMLVSTFSTVAGEKVWVGESGGQWNTASNWSPAGVPQYTDIVIFRPGENEKLVVMNGVISTCGGMRFESGETFVLTTANRIYLNKGTNEVFVAAGAYATVSNAVVSRGEDPRTTLRRTGGGTLHLVGADSWGNDYGKFTAWDFAGGTTVLDGSANTQVAAPATIRRGAVVKAPHDYTFHGSQTDLVIEKGGLLDLEGANTTYLASISGEGTVSNLTLITNIQLPRGPYVFSGDVYPKAGSALATITFAARGAAIAEADWKLVLGSSKAFSRVKVEFPNSTDAPIGFAPGIGLFQIGQIQGNDKSMLTLEDTDGNPVEVDSDWLNPAKLRLAGSGAFYNGDAARSGAGSVIDISGLTGTIGTRSSEFTLGNETDAGWPTVNPNTTFCSKGGTFYLKPGPTPGAAVGKLTGAGTFGFYGNLEIKDARTTGAWWQVRDNSDVTVSGGYAQLGGYNIYLYSGCKFTVCNGAYVGGKDAVPGYSTWGTKAKRHLGTPLQSGSEIGTVTVRDGGWYCADGIFARSTTVKDGGVWEMARNCDAKSATAANPYVVTWDGGKLVGNITVSPYDLLMDATDSKIRNQIGAGGLRIDCQVNTMIYNDGYDVFRFRSPIYSVDGVTDGGIVRTGAGFLDFMEPLQIKGLFDNRDGTVRVRKDATSLFAAETPLFGFGDFRLGNARFEIHHEITSAVTAKIGTGGSFRYNGAATVRLRWDANDPAHTVLAGTLAREDHGTLFVWDNINNGTFGNGGGFKPSTEPVTNENGRVCAPVFTYWGGRLHFAAVDGGAVVPFANYTEGVDGGAGSVALVSEALATVNENKTVAALNVRGLEGHADTRTSGNCLTIAKDATLAVGGGSDPACVILDNFGSQGVAAIGGEGALDFGTREGVVVANNRIAGSYPARITATIAGSGSVTFAAPIDFASGNAIELGGCNTYEGGTFVNGVRVMPTVENAFSSGLVTLGDGELGGGGVLMAKEGLVIRNDFRAAGWGPRDRNRGNSELAMGFGAFFFTQSGEIAGDVEVYAPMRIGAYEAGVRGVFSGELSGDAIQLFKCAGTTVFAHANSYTGGTDIVASTLALTDDGTAGTGEIMLDDGTLVLENAEAKTVANRIRGLGTVRLAGKGKASFANLDSQDGAGFTLDVAAKVATVGSLDGFSAITTSRTRPTALIVADGDITSYTGEIPANVTLYRPGEYVPPGMMLIVR